MMMREKLITDMTLLANEGRWEEHVYDLLIEILELRPDNPYVYLHHKYSLRQKFDNSKSSQFLSELAIYLSNCNPLHTNKEQFVNKIISYCVDKYQHTKIRRTQSTMLGSEIMSFVQVILLGIPERCKQHYLKLVEKIVEKESFTVLEFVEVLYHTILFLHVVKELNVLENKLSVFEEQIRKDVLRQYLFTVTEQTSIMKKIGLESEGDGDVYKTFANDIAERIDV